MAKNKKNLCEALEDAAQFVEEGRTRLALIYEATAPTVDDESDFPDFYACLNVVIEKLGSVRSPKEDRIIGILPTEDGVKYESAFVDGARDKYDEYVAIYDETQNAFVKEILLDVERVRALVEISSYPGFPLIAKQLGAIVDKIKAKAIR